tara:strand:- start:27 stop:1472 length:1446 start_codon:yes stop_codon:yes gene_type:complete
MRFLIVILFSVYFASSQCPNNNEYYETIAAPTVVGNSVSTILFPGEYSHVTNMIAGNVYEISTCDSDDEENNFDSEITIYQEGFSFWANGYNDDYIACDGRSRLNFSPFTTNDYDILLNEYPCDANEDNLMYVTITLISTPLPVITIPVVVHVLYNNATQNISNNQIYSQIDILNEDFRRANDAIFDVPSRFLGFSKDARIEFCLASQDPNGNYTNGITRTQTDVTAFSWMQPTYSLYGGYDAWNTQDYLNIWVCNIEPSEDGGNILGYATFPGGMEMGSDSNPNQDGIVIDYEYFGNIGTGNNNWDYDQGQTATHEVGHWLGLYHTFQGEDELYDEKGNVFAYDGCTGYGDYVNDTPFQYASTVQCPDEVVISCPNMSYVGYGGDMYSNFMDYTTPHSCMQMFTYIQYLRMYNTLYEGYRDAIRYSNGCDPPNNTDSKDYDSVPRKLIKTIDILGREATNKGFQLQIYDDGTVEKKYIIK